VAAGTCRLGLEGAVAADGFSVYVSRWGALHEADGRHLDLTTQAEVFEWLGRRCPAVGRLLSRWEGLPATMLALAHDPALRVQVRDLLREHGCAGPTGFERFVHGAAAEGSPGGEAAPPP
jgi:hypothetical protein